MTPTLAMCMGLGWRVRTKTMRSKNIAKKGRRELEEGVQKCIEQALGLLPPPQVSLMINVLGHLFRNSRQIL